MKPHRELTPRQLDVALFIRNFRHVHGYAPTYDEMVAGLGISRPTIFGHIDALVTKGVIRYDRYKARSLDIVGELPPRDATNLPLLGLIAAGEPVQVAPAPATSIDLEKFFNSKHGAFVLKVRGNSLIDQHIADGDFVVCERREDARSGEKVVAIIDQYFSSLRTFTKGAGGSCFLNGEMFPADRVRIYGVVIGVIRSEAR